MIKVDRLSLITRPLQMFFDKQRGGQGTGFIWRTDGRVYLVTALHNFTGQDTDTQENLDKENGLRPNLCLMSHVSSSGEIMQMLFSLYHEEKPDWLVHDTIKNADVAVIELDPTPFSHLKTLNELTKNNIVLNVGLDVFTIGYPFFSRILMPIWKRGTIAAEIDHQVDVEGFNIIDTATLPGMSGAPVIFRGNNYTTNDGTYVMNATSASQLLGVYSGRLLSEDKRHTDTQLARVWPAKIIQEIINRGMRDHLTLMP